MDNCVVTPQEKGRIPAEGPELMIKFEAGAKEANQNVGKKRMLLD